MMGYYCSLIVIMYLTVVAASQVPHQGDVTAACPLGLQSLRQEHGL